MAQALSNEPGSAETREKAPEPSQKPRKPHKLAPKLADRARRAHAKPPGSEARKVEWWPLAKVLPYAMNARDHSDGQVGQIAGSIKRYGFNNPLLVDIDGVLVAGHGRALAAQKLALKSVPVIRLGHLSKAEARAYRLADNKIALNATWNFEALGAELGSLRDEGQPIEELGFTGTELEDALKAAGLGAEPAGASGAGEPEQRELTSDERSRLDKAWLQLVDDWKSIVFDAGKRGWISPNHTKGTLAVQFVRAMLYGGDIHRNATLAYTGHRIFVNGDDRPLSDVFDSAREKPNVLSSLQWFVGSRITIDELIGKQLPVQGHRIPPDFPAALARDLIDEFCPQGGSVLDPCHGWGGRMLGFLMSKAKGYHGFDVDERTVAGVKAMFGDLMGFCDRKKFASVELCPFEDAVLKNECYDFALTSPPYFDTERYDGELSSWKRYPTFERWVAGFFRPLVEKAGRALKPGAVLALQVGSQKYPLEKLAREIAPGAGFEHTATRGSGMKNSFHETDAEEGEVIVVLRKRGGGDAATRYGKVL